MLVSQFKCATAYVKICHYFNPLSQPLTSEALKTLRETLLKTLPETLQKTRNKKQLCQPPL